MTEERAIHTIWDYMRVGHRLRKADMMLVACSYDTRVAERAAEIFHQGWAPLVTISGGGFSGGLTGDWEKSEAEVFADVMQAAGVPETKLILETTSENTGENAKLSAELWARKGLNPKTVIVVQKSYFERRAYATFKKWWPEREIIVTSPELSFEEWVAKSAIPRKRTVDAMVGDVWRIKEYPAKGFQIPQEIPDAVWAAYEFLVAQGYSRPERPGPKTRPPE